MADSQFLLELFGGLLLRLKISIDFLPVLQVVRDHPIDLSKR